jgi:serine/threonine-protein kinase RsbW
MTGEFAKGLQALDEIFAFLGEFAGQHGLDETVRLCIDLVAEELFTNAVKHGSGADGRVQISVEKVGQDLRLELVDFDAEPFDPLSLKPVALGAQIETRKAGGLGIHLVRSLVDDLTYEYRDREMRVLVTKHLEA